MAIYRDNTTKCEKCNKLFEYEYYSFVRMPKDTNIKEEVLSGEIHYHDCPECGYRNYEPVPLLYVDDEKEVAIIANSYEEAIGDKIDLQEEFPGYRFYIAETPWIMPDIINAIDNNLDPLVLEFIKYDGVKFFEKKTRKYQVRNAYISYSDEGYEIKLVLVVSDFNGDIDDKEITIDSNLYNSYVEKVEKFKQGADLSIISPVYVKKLYSLARNLEIEEAKQSLYEFLLCRDEYDDAVLAFVQSFNEGKFKEGEKVALVHYDKKDNCNIVIYKVERILHMSNYEYYSEINNLPVATYKITGFDLESSLPCDIELHNEELKVALSDGFEEDNYELLFNSNVILPMKLASYIEDIMENNISKDSMEKEHLCYKLNNKFYFPIYLDQSDVMTEHVCNSLIVDFKTALKVFFSIANNYDGIIINPDNDLFLILLNNLFTIITNRVMTNPVLMKDFVDNASKEEINFIGKDKYNLIKKVYSTDIGLEAIREELNLTKEKADYMLGDGYARIQRIIRSKIIM